MTVLWPSCGYERLQINDQNQLVVTDAFLSRLLQRPELSPVETSCETEYEIFNRLSETPRVAIPPESLAKIQNQDVADNYRVWLRFRDRLLAAPTLEANYKAFFQAGHIDFPPILVDDITQVLVRHVLGHPVSAAQASVTAVGAIEDEQWAWHLGLDAQSTAILNDLYLGNPMD
ncbi:MAG: hypothetical protein RIR28_1136, partial [Pseudomonadota bacterium]